MSGRAIIERRRRVFDDFFKIDELLVVHEQIDRTMSPVQRRLVFERGDSVAILRSHVQRKTVLLVEQFRAPALVGRRRDDPSTADGWVVETVAGTVDANETPEAAAIRETFEETGYQISTVAPDRQGFRLAGRHFGAHFSVFCRGPRRRPDRAGRRHRRRRYQDRGDGDRRSARPLGSTGDRGSEVVDRSLLAARPAEITWIKRRRLE